VRGRCERLKKLSCSADGAEGIVLKGDDLTKCGRENVIVAYRVLNNEVRMSFFGLGIADMPDISVNH
jgi:hypothetical protein